MNTIIITAFAIASITNLICLIQFKRSADRTLLELREKEEDDKKVLELCRKLEAFYEKTFKGEDR